MSETETPNPANSNTVGSTQSESFNFHYTRLQEIATKLQQGLVDIDELETLVKQSLTSKQYCEARIERVKQAVEGLLETNTPTQAGEPQT